MLIPLLKTIFGKKAAPAPSPAPASGAGPTAPTALWIVSWNGLETYVAEYTEVNRHHKAFTSESEAYAFLTSLKEALKLLRDTHSRRMEITKQN